MFSIKRVFSRLNWLLKCFSSGRLEVCLMGCQDLLESVPGRGRVTSVLATPGSLSDGKSLKVRAGLSGRSANGKTTKTDDLSCKCPNNCPSFILPFV